MNSDDLDLDFDLKLENFFNSTHELDKFFPASFVKVAVVTHIYNVPINGIPTTLDFDLLL